MKAPAILPSSSNWMSKCLPKRDELLLRIVFAFPIASITGLVCISFDATLSLPVDALPDTSPM